MTPPAVAAGRWLLGWAVGWGLGVVSCFLQPLRKRLPNLADTVFVLCLFL